MIEEIAPLLDKVDRIHFSISKDKDTSKVSVLVNIEGGDGFPPFVLSGDHNEIDLQLGLELMALSQELVAFKSNMEEIRSELAKRLEEAKKETKPTTTKPKSRAKKKAKKKAEPVEVIRHELEAKPSDTSMDDLLGDL
jgi:Sec-independent protein translocase protein TatA